MDFFAELLKAFSPAEEAHLFMWLLAALGLIAGGIAIERWVVIGRRSDYDAPALFEKIKSCLEVKKSDDALGICLAGRYRALPAIIACGIRQAQTEPALVVPVMNEESIAMTAALEKRLDFLVMFGNVSTLFGLLGTVFGLIMSFDAVSQPNVSAIEKSAMLAAGISTAMNSTLVGLSISVVCVMIYSILRAKVERTLAEIERFATAVVRLLCPKTAEVSTGMTRTTSRSGGSEEEADTDVTPMLNLMVILIPVLLTSSEFVKVGSIDLVLPQSEAVGEEAGDENGAGAQEEVKLDLGVVITKNGFSLLHYFKDEAKAATVSAESQPGGKNVDIPLKDGTYDFGKLTAELSKVKQKALFEVMRMYGTAVKQTMSIDELYALYRQKNPEASKTFPDIEDIKIVAEEQIQYQTVVSTMDAARGIKTAAGFITMFPNVAIAGGIVP
ncbi:MAG: MotA/TolQ/ExbB proton channel family protein [Chitinivibrionales bacterium]|nr:MotA/TolQ/ExbB proton channel family protein [Chitinivibrionales bacterium]